jgi:hypothetical protein
VDAQTDITVAWKSDDRRQRLPGLCLLAGANQIAILHFDDTSLVALYKHGDSVRGAICVDSPRALISCSQMIMHQLPRNRAMAGVEGLTVLTDG